MTISNQNQTSALLAGNSLAGSDIVKDTEGETAEQWIQTLKEVR